MYNYFLLINENFSIHLYEVKFVIKFIYYKIRWLYSITHDPIRLGYSQSGREHCKNQNDCLDNYYCKRINNKSSLNCNCPCYLCTGKGL